MGQAAIAAQAADLRAEPGVAPAYRAEPVGSMLRPGYLQEAHRDHQAGALADERLRHEEDTAVRAAIAAQAAAGLDVVTDGEQRRAVFFDHLFRAVSGLSLVPGMTVVLRDDQGGSYTMQCPVSVTGRVERVRGIAFAEYTYAQAHSRLPVKATMASPFLIHAAWNPELSRRAYRDPWRCFTDCAEVLRAEARDLARAGCRYIQIDAPELLVLWCGGPLAAQLDAAGLPVEKIKHEGIDVLNDITAAAPGVLWGLHMCRGNGQGKWLAAGGYEEAARYMFPRTAGFGRLLLEYDDGRSGGFEPLRYLPASTVAVLGLVSTKHDRLEEVSGIVARIEAAARFADLGQLAVSTQCGFAAAADGSVLSEAAQAGKLRVVADAARQVWN
ncbi:MAG: cobalamin-independent methionine synthase II family protein [Streptosporangiaceae bacterium]